MSDTMVTAVTDDNFDTTVLKSSPPVLVDFWAPWCAPCRAIAPMIEEIAQHYGERLKVVKMDVDENGQTAAKYNIRGIPALMLFKEGDSVDTHVGMLTKAQLTEFLDKHI